MAKTKADLEAELDDLAKDLKTTEEEASRLKVDNDLLQKSENRLEIKINGLEEELEESTAHIRTMDDQTKHELYIENFDKFTVYQFENFLKMIEFL